MLPVRPGELVEGDQPVPVVVRRLADGGHALRRAPRPECPRLALGRLPRLGGGDRGEEPPALGLQPPRQLVEQVQDPVGPAIHRLPDAGRSLWTTSCVIVETVALLQHRFGLAAVRDLTEHVVPALSLEWVSEALHRKRPGRLCREDRRRLSLVDCVSLEAMRAHGPREAVALDRPFAEAFAWCRRAAIDRIPGRPVA
jgi:predicted nucleic acid-binding protein